MQMTNEFSRSPGWKLKARQEEERSWNDARLALPPDHKQWTVHHPPPPHSLSSFTAEIGQCSYKAEIDHLHDGYELEGEFEGSTERMESLVSGLLDDAHRGSHAAAAAAAAAAAQVSSCGGHLSPNVLRMFQELRMQDYDPLRNSTCDGFLADGEQRENCTNDDFSGYRGVLPMQGNSLRALYGDEGQLVDSLESFHAMSSLSSRSEISANGDSYFANSEQSIPGGLMMQNALDHAAANAELELLMMKEREFKAMIRDYNAEIQTLKEREYLMMRNAREQAFAVLKENEELQKYKALATELQPVAERLLIERQSTLKKNAEVVNWCLEIYKHNCILQEKIAATEKHKSEIMQMQAIDCSSDERPAAAKFFGKHNSAAAHPTMNTVSSAGYLNVNTVSTSPESGVFYNNVAPALTPAAPSTAFCRSNHVVGEKKPVSQYLRNQISPKQVHVPTKNRSSYSRTPALKLDYGEMHPGKFLSATNPRTPKSVLSFPNTSPPSRFASNDNLVPSIDISGVNDESSADIFGTPLSAKLSAVLVKSPETGLKTRTACHDNQTAEVLIPEGAKSISIRLKGEKSVGKKSNSFKGSSWRGGKAVADLRRSRSLSPIRLLDMASLNDEGPTAIQVNIPSNDNSAPVELNVSNQGQLKTELCNNWVDKGNCPYGTYCRFAHGMGELRCVLRHPRYKTTPCRMIMEGLNCVYGHRCHFRHSLTDDEKSEIRTA